MMTADQNAAWWIYSGAGVVHDGISRLPRPPKWRVFDGSAAATAPEAPGQGDSERRQGATYRPDSATAELVNAAIYLRRPMLVTGRPGTGKSTLAVSIAHELGLGRILRWNITSRATLRDGLYQYDPMARLHSTSRAARSGEGHGHDDDLAGRYITLGSLGTALLPSALPRVLLIDEIDKSDMDLPNDLLAIFEDGRYEIPELVRQTTIADQEVLTADGLPVSLNRGVVQCRDFPITVMTSNDEREFPPAFLRRCIQIELKQPDEEKINIIVKAHLDSAVAEASGDLIQQFLEHESPEGLATDQLLNAIYLTDEAARSGAIDRLGLARKVMVQLTRRQDDD